MTSCSCYKLQEQDGAIGNVAMELHIGEGGSPVAVQKGVDMEGGLQGGPTKGEEGCDMTKRQGTKCLICSFVALPASGLQRFPPPPGRFLHGLHPTLCD